MKQERRKPDLELVRTAANEAGRQGALTCLETLGFDIKDISECQLDVAHLRASRKVCQNVKRQALNTGVISAISGILLAMWLGIKELAGR